MICRFLVMSLILSVSVFAHAEPAMCELHPNSCPPNTFPIKDAPVGDCPVNSCSSSLPGASIVCDAGMCGPSESIIGSRIEPVLHRFLTSMPVKFQVAQGPVMVCGACIDVDTATGRALAITRIREVWRPPGE